MAVIFYLTYQQRKLKAEEMINLPIMLAEQTQGWKEAVSDAVANRNRLATEAQKDTDYIRPIALLQQKPKMEK